MRGYSAIFNRTSQPRTICLQIFLSYTLLNPVSLVASSSLYNPPGKFDLPGSARHGFIPIELRSLSLCSLFSTVRALSARGPSAPAHVTRILCVAFAFLSRILHACGPRARTIPTHCCWAFASRLCCAFLCVLALFALGVRRLVPVWVYGPYCTYISSWGLVALSSTGLVVLLSALCLLVCAHYSCVVAWRLARLFCWCVAPWWRHHYPRWLSLVRSLFRTRVALAPLVSKVDHPHCVVSFIVPVVACSLAPR